MTKRSGDVSMRAQPVLRCDRVCLATTSKVRIGGLLAEGLESSREGRLKALVRDERSEAIRIYRREAVRKSESKGWQGECAGKWLYAASRCALRTGDADLCGRIRRVADFLVHQQDADGYLGTYNPLVRFCSTRGEPRQTFDLWMNGYIMQGLMEAYRLLGKASHLAAVVKIADLCIRTYRDGRRSVVNAGPFSGMGSASVLEHFVDLHVLTGEARHLDFAEHCLRELNRRPGTEILDRCLKGYDVAQIDEGKMYEMLRCFTGMARLYRVTGAPTLLRAVRHAWSEIRRHHLNAAGAPCGGIGGHHECFNARYTFSPYARSETCAMMEWLRFTVEMLRITGDAACAEAIEQVAYNALPGAQFPDGRGWTYHSVMNGKRERTGEFACCSSSGTMALEELPPVLYTTRGDGVFVNVYGPSRARLDVGGGSVDIEQVTAYPFDGAIRFVVRPDRARRFTVALRVPAWLDGAAFAIDGKPTSSRAGGYREVTRTWQPGDSLAVTFPLPVRLVEAVREYNEKGWYLDGATRFRAVCRGPLLHAANGRDEEGKENPLTVPASFSPADLRPVSVEGRPALRAATLNGRRTFVPYFAVGGRKPNTRRAVWMKEV